MELVRVPEAAEYLRVSKSYLDKLRVYGGGPLYVKMGQRILYDRTDLNTWLVGRKVANTSQPLRVAA